MTCLYKNSSNAVEKLKTATTNLESCLRKLHDIAPNIYESDTAGILRNWDFDMGTF